MKLSIVLIMAILVGVIVAALVFIQRVDAYDFKVGLKKSDHKVEYFCKCI